MSISTFVMFSASDYMMNGVLIWRSDENEVDWSVSEPDNRTISSRDHVGTRVLSRKHNSCLNTSVINRAGGASHPTFVVQATRSWMDFIAARPFIGGMRAV